MAETGSTIFLYIDDKIVGKANEVSVDARLDVEESHSLGKYGPDEICYSEMPAVPVSMVIERWSYDGLVARGLWPDVSSDFNIMNYKPVTVLVQSKKTGAMLHKVSGFRPTSKPISFRKGQKAVYQLDGVGLREMELDT